MTRTEHSNTAEAKKKEMIFEITLQRQNSFKSGNKKDKQNCRKTITLLK